MKLTHRRVKLDEMASFVKEHHRHTAPLRRHMFSIGAYEDWCNPYDLFGVATVDNCSSAWSKRADHTELRRLCTRPGAPPNVARYLLGQVKKAVWGMGYRVLVTYTQPYENGRSLLASGFHAQKARAMFSIRVPNTTRACIHGGLVQWVAVRGRQPDERERAQTKKFLAETNEAYDRERRKLATEGFDLFPTREAMRHG